VISSFEMEEMHRNVGGVKEIDALRAKINRLSSDSFRGRQHPEGYEPVVLWVEEAKTYAQPNARAYKSTITIQSLRKNNRSAALARPGIVSDGCLGSFCIESAVDPDLNANSLVYCTSHLRHNERTLALS
jgi:hypothetical protein